MTASWTFGQKLAATLAVLMLLAAAIAGVSVYALNRVATTHELLMTTTVENLIGAERLRSALLDKAAQIRGFLLSGNESFARGMAAAEQQFAATLRDIRDRAGPEASQRIREIEDAMARFQAAVDTVAAERRQSPDVAGIVTTFEQTQAPLFRALDDRITELVERERTRLAEGTAEALAVGGGAQTTVVGASVAAIALSALLAVLLGRTLARQIGSSVQHVRSSSTELQAAASQQASGAKEQATAMSEISTTITELLTTSRQIAESAQRVADVAEEAARGTVSGRGAVHEAERAIENIRQQVDTIVRHMLDVGKKSQQIGGILAIINELSEQTNILAINATIEAAGAGEAGKRFAVVGDEVRKLAERVGGSSKQVAALIEEMREAVNATVMATETHSKAVDTGAQTFTRLISVLDEITTGVDTTKEVAREIELSTKQQTTAVEQVNVAIADVAQATREAEAGSSQTLQTASQLAGLSDQLARLIHAANTAHA